MNLSARVLRPLVLAIVAVGLLGGGAAADEGRAAFGLQPLRYDPQRPATQSYFVYNAGLGQVIEDEVVVYNRGTGPGTARLYAVDMTTGQNSGAVFREAHEPRQAVGSWIRLSQQEITLAPGERRQVPFTVTIPDSAAPGQQLGGIVVEDTALRADTQGGIVRVNVQSRSAIAVQANLPGPMVERITVTGIAAGGAGGFQQLLLGLRNDGTELAKPTGTLVVADATGREVQRIALKLDTILPRTEIQYPVLVERQALGAGAYDATVRLDYGKGGTTDYRGEFTVTQEQIAQTFQGAQLLAPPPGAAAPAPQGAAAPSLVRQVWSAVAGAAVALALGATLFLFWQRRAATRRG
jgi:hypothetical protein